MAVVSIIIPTFKHADFILRTLDSVFAQTFGDYEIIVINDGSPDATAAVLAPLVEAGKILYIEQPNAGQASARNRGIGVARGEFLAFLDDDDVWPTDKLEWQVRILRDDPNLSMVGGASGLIDGDTLIEPSAATPHAGRTVGVFEMYCGNPFYSPGQTLIRTTALHKIAGFDPSVWGTDDHDLYIRLASVGGVAVNAKVGLYYRKHAGNASNATHRMYWNGLRVLKKNITLVPSSQRRMARRKAHRWLAYLFGWRAMREGSWPDAARVATSLAKPALHDPLLMGKMLHPFMPKAVRRFIDERMSNNK